MPQWTDWENPDRAALQVMDFVLGGSGFTSRLLQRIRSDEGLAYGASSDFSFDPHGPGAFTISFESKSETVALAARIALEEMRRLQTEPVSAAELGVAKASLIETFPQRFQSAQQIVGTYASDAFIGRSHVYWRNWRAQVRALPTFGALYANWSIAASADYTCTEAEGGITCIAMARPCRE